MGSRVVILKLLLVLCFGLVFGWILQSSYLLVGAVDKYGQCGNLSSVLWSGQGVSYER